MLKLNFQLYCFPIADVCLFVFGHFERDAWRAGQVRNSGLTKGEDAGFIDKAEWKRKKKRRKSNRNMD